MSNSAAITLDGVSKKYCRSLKQSMIYGLSDITRDLAGISVRSDILRDEEYWALRDISLIVEPGECVGVIGPNGAGKSTLLKLVAGIFPPDTGRVRVRSRVGTLLEVGAGFHPLLSGRENVFINGSILGLKNREIRKHFDEIVAFSELEEFIDSPVKHYSSGMYVRLGFAVAAHLSPDVLLVDEALAVGDTAFRFKCINRIAEMRREGTAVLFVSHSESQIRGAADRCLLISHGNSEVFEHIDEAFLCYQDIAASSFDRLVDHADYQGELELTQVKLESPGEDNHIVSGDKFGMHIHFNVNTPISAAYLIMRIWNAHGQLAAVVDSRDEGATFDLHEGVAIVSVDISSLPLVPGRYRIGGGLRRGMQILGWSTQLAWLDIMPRPGQPFQEGIMALSINYSMEIKHLNNNCD